MFAINRKKNPHGRLLVAESSVRINCFDLLIGVYCRNCIIHRGMSPSLATIEPFI